MNLVKNKMGYGALIVALDVDGYHYCLASAAARTDIVLCRYADHINIDRLQAHDRTIHGIDTVNGQNKQTKWISRRGEAQAGGARNLRGQAK